MRVFFQKSELLEILGSLRAFFIFKGHKAGHRASELSELFVLQVVDLLVDFSHEIEVVGRDGGTALFEQFNELGVVEGKLCNSNLDLVHWFIFKTEVWHLRKSALNALGEPRAEVDNHGCCDILFEPMFFDKLRVEFFRNVELDGVVSSRDRLDVPLDVIVLG